MKWQDFFKIVYHPNPGRYYIHWLSNSSPIGDPFWEKYAAEKWVGEHYRSMIDYAFEEIVLK
jgi:hypothetical protein